MNLSSLDLKVKQILEAHSLLIKEPVEQLDGVRVGVSDSYLFGSVLSAPDYRYGVVYSSPKEELLRFKEMMNPMQFEVVLSGGLNASEVYWSKSDQQSIWNRVPSYLSLYYSNDVMIQAFQELNIEYMVAPSSSYIQLRQLLQDQHISAILAPMSLLEYCSGFRDLQHLIITIDDGFFYWVDIKQLTLKSQLSLDSWADMYIIYKYMTDVQFYTPEDYDPIYTSVVLEEQAQKRYQEPYTSLNEMQARDLLFQLTYQTFSGKVIFEAKLAKASSTLRQQHMIGLLRYWSLIKLSPSIGLSSSSTDVYQFPLSTAAERAQCLAKLGPQLPQELQLLRQVGLGLIETLHRKRSDVKRTRLPIQLPHEYAELQIEETFLHSKALLTSKVPQLAQGPTLTLEKQFLDMSYNPPRSPSIQDAVNIYYKKLKLSSKLNSRKGSEAMSPGDDNSGTISYRTIAYNVMIRMMNHLTYLSCNASKGSIFASALLKVSPWHSDAALLLLEVMLRNQSHIFIEHFADDEQQPSLWAQGFDQTSIIVVSRVFTLLSHTITVNPHKTLSSYDHELFRFLTLIESLRVKFTNLYEANLIRLYFELNDRQHIQEFCKAARYVPMRKPFNTMLGSAIILLMTKRMSAEKLCELIPDLQSVLGKGLALLKDLVLMLEYIQTKASQLQGLPVLKILDYFKKAEFIANSVFNLNINYKQQ